MKQKNHEKINNKLSAQEKAWRLKDRYDRIKKLKDLSPEIQESYEKVKGEVERFILKHPDLKEFF